MTVRNTVISSESLYISFQSCRTLFETSCIVLAIAVKETSEETKRAITAAEFGEHATLSLSKYPLNTEPPALAVWFDSPLPIALHCCTQCFCSTKHCDCFGFGLYSLWALGNIAVGYRITPLTTHQFWISTYGSAVLWNRWSTRNRRTDLRRVTWEAAHVKKKFCEMLSEDKGVSKRALQRWKLI
jgi:hypothetical protein